MNRAYSILQIKTVNDDLRIIEGIATTPTPDRVGDIVEPLGAKFKLPMPLLWQHNSEKPVGHVEFAKPNKNGIPFKARIAKIEEPGELKNLVDMAWQAVKAELVRAVSIGFIIDAFEILKSGGWRISEWEWLELSLVTIPANSDATIQTVKSIDAGLLAASGKKQPASKSAPGASGHLTRSQTKGTGIMKNFAEKISALEAQLTPKSARMQAIMQTAIDDGDRKLNESEAEEFDGLEIEVKDLEVELRRLKALDRSSKTVKAVEGDDTNNAAASRSGRIPAEAKKTEEKGLGFARYAMCLAVAKGDPMRAMQVAKQRYPQAVDIQTMLKAQVAGGTTTDPTFAEPLVVATNLISEFVDYLRPRTIVGRFGQGGIPSLRRVPFNVRVPAQTSPASAGWVGEGKAKPVTRFGVTSATLRWTKVAGITVLSEDLLRFSTPSAETLTRDELARALQARLDSDFINPSISEQADIRPAAITNGAQTYTSSLLDADGVRTELKELITYFITNDQPTSDGVLIMRDAQALSLQMMRNALGQREFPDITKNGGVLEGFPVITSQYVPAGVVALCNASDIYLADDGAASIDISREASLEMDDAPANLINDGASPPVSVEATMVSMFQTNSVAIRAERMITWKRRRATAVAYLTATSWGSGDSSPPPAAI